jgi:hypothetical protein
MTKKVETLVEKCKVFQMLEGRILVHPLKLRSYKTTDMVPDDEANRGKNPMLEELKLKKKVLTVNYAYQKAIVLNVPSNITNIAVGDTIIYRLNNLQDFELIKGVSMLKGYEVVSIIKA